MQSYFRYIPSIVVALSFFLQSCRTSADELPIVKLDFKRTELSMRTAWNGYRRDSLQSQQAVYRNFFLPDRNFYIDWLYQGDTLLADSIIAFDLLDFSFNPYTQQLIDSVLLRYPENYSFEQMLTPPLQRFKKEFPNFSLPAFRTYISGYKEPGQLTMDPLYFSGTYMGIGLHYFLGEKFAYYPSDIPQFVRRRCRPESLVPAVLLEFCNYLQKPLDPKSRPTLLAQMIHAGARYYFLDRMLPDTPDSIKISYTEKELRWTQAFIRETYNDMIPLLYETDFFKYEKYIQERPFTPTISHDSPGRLGVYIGWQIVRKFMHENPDYPLLQLLQTTDFDTIFKESNFKP